MRYLVASDLHGSYKYGKLLLERFDEEKAEKLILLGDLYYHGPRNPLSDEYDPMKLSESLNAVKDKLFVMRGNCDAEVDEMISEFKFNAGYATLELAGGHKLTVTHGHYYDDNDLPPQCGDVFLFGHIHQGFVGKKKDGTIVGNPGSTSLPKGGSPRSYIIIDDNCVILKQLDDAKEISRIQYNEVQ